MIEKITYLQLLTRISDGVAPERVIYGDVLYTWRQGRGNYSDVHNYDLDVAVAGNMNMEEQTSGHYIEVLLNEQGEKE